MLINSENVISLPMRGGKTTKAIQYLHDAAELYPNKTHFYICPSRDRVDNAKFHYKHLYIQIPDNVKFISYARIADLQGHAVGRCCLDEFERAEICRDILAIDNFITDSTDTFFFTGESCQCINARLSMLRSFWFFITRNSNG